MRPSIVLMEALGPLARSQARAYGSGSAFLISRVVGVRPSLGMGEWNSFARSYSLDPEDKRSVERLTVEW